MRSVVVGLAALSLQGCGDRTTVLGEQIAGRSCQFEAEFDGRPRPKDEREYPGSREFYRCRRRDITLWSLVYPQRTATCQVDAARCIATTGDRSLVPILTRALSEQSDEYDTGDGMIFVRANIAETLGVLGDEQAIEPLTRVLNESRVEAKAAISYALAVFGDKAHAAGSKLAEVFNTPNPKAEPRIDRLRSAAALSLCRVAPNIAQATFTPVLREPFGDLRLTQLVLDAMRKSDIVPGLDDPLRALGDSLARRPPDTTHASGNYCLLWWVCDDACGETERRGGAFSGPDCSQIDPQCQLR